MARGLKPHCFLVPALVLISFILLFSASQARPLCAPNHVNEPTDLSHGGSAHYLIDILGLWGIKSSGPSPPGEGH